MNIISISRPLLAGILHSFDPDHVTTVSVLAAQNAADKKKFSWTVVFKASQWALGHSATLIIFGAVAIVFKSSLHLLIEDISEWAQLVVGPIMILLGLQALTRNYNFTLPRWANKLPIGRRPMLEVDTINDVTEVKQKVNPFTRSFWVGMLHGLAGTGGVLTSALILSASSFGESIGILVIESIGIIFTMGVYSCILIATMGRFLERRVFIFKCMNGLAGASSVALGIYLLVQSFTN
ncbi:MAG: hypothetical protein H7329_13575 [Opitutaceae bacterium]|nr:hypothetical protein [Cytophagales bacterium]